MSRSTRFFSAVVVVGVLLLGVALALRSWGGVALIVLAGAAGAWYRAQVAEGEAAERFFGDMGEETRLTGFQGGSPSELPLDRTLSGSARPAPPDGR